MGVLMISGVSDQGALPRKGIETDLAVLTVCEADPDQAPCPARRLGVIALAFLQGSKEPGKPPGLLFAVCALST